MQNIINFPYYAHNWIEGNSDTSITNAADMTQSNAKLPTNYGIGKGNALANLASFKMVDSLSNIENTTLSQQIQVPYQDTKWVAWAQHFCRPACHRDSMYQIVQVRTQDFIGKPTLSFLSRKMSSSSSGAQQDPLTVVKCAKCPPFFAAYTW